jgi:hypothetical protein
VVSATDPIIWDITDESQPTFQRNILPPSSRSKSKLAKKKKERIKQAANVQKCGEVSIINFL